MIREALAFAKARWTRSRDASSDSSRQASVRSLARSLNDRSRCTLLSFYSPNCKLCHHVAPRIEKVVAEESHWLSVVRMSVDDEVWVPEVSYYSVNYVPCLILLDRRNRALFKSGVPTSHKVVMDSLGAILAQGRRRFARKRRL